MSRAAGSVSSTKAEWQCDVQWNCYCHQPVIDIQFPAQLSCQNMQFTLESNGHNLTSLHMIDKKRKSLYVQDHHWQTLIILVGSYIILYIYIYL